MKISIIVASDQNLAIGRDNQLPWHLPNDLKFFKNKTMGHHMLMGRNTLESIGKILPGRTSVVVTRQEDYQFEGAIIAHSIQEAIDLVKLRNEDELFIIGGAEVINQALHLADTIYYTEVKTKIEDANVFLKSFHLEQWNLVSQELHPADEKHAFEYEFITYERKTG
jgi:dihydrofolate reductase